MGSPPQVRGKLSDILCRRVTVGDHPRRCGENDLSCCNIDIMLGSPPQVRGKLADYFFRVNGVGITPAGAGKTECRELPMCTEPDHPRRCGENKILYCHTVNLRGSPPQVRGKQGKITCPLMNWRITPAGAGKTLIYRDICHCKQDHPRRCGENPVLHDFRAVSTGSPPQVRGKPLSFLHFFELDRITPAGAGKTCLTKLIKR